MDSKLKLIIGENKTFLNRREYKLCLTAFLGHTPADFELELVFQENCTIPLIDVKKIITRHICRNSDKEFEAMQVFRVLDAEGKGYVDLQDIYRVWKEELPYLSWTNLQECFADVSVDNKICYDLFKTMYIAHM